MGIGSTVCKPTEGWDLDNSVQYTPTGRRRGIPHAAGNETLPGACRTSSNFSLNKTGRKREVLAGRHSTKTAMGTLTVGKPKLVKGEDNLECHYDAPKISATVMTSPGEAFCLSMSKGSATKPFPQIAPKAIYVFNVGSLFVPKHGTCAVITTVRAAACVLWTCRSSSTSREIFQTVLWSCWER